MRTVGRIFLFLFFLAALVEGAYFLPIVVDIPALLDRYGIIDRLEPILDAVKNRFGTEPRLSVILGERAGRCARAADGAGEAPTAFPIPWRFSVPEPLVRTVVRCVSPEPRMPFFFSPAPEASVTVRRRLSHPMRMELMQGGITISSEKLDVVVDAKFVDIGLRSEGPVELLFTDIENQLRVVAMKGKLEVVPVNDEPGPAGDIRPVRFQANPGAEVESGGKLIAKGTMTSMLFPSGFQALPGLDANP